MQNNNETILNQAKDLVVFVVQYFKDPIASVKNPPSFDWQQIILLQAIAASLSGFLNGLVSSNIIFIFWGLLIFPIVALALSFIASLFIHYAVKFMFSANITMLNIFSLIVLANLPFLLIRIASPLLQSLDIIGFIITSFLLSVGLIERHRLEKRKVIKLMSAIAVFVIITWLIQVSFSMYASREYFDVDKFKIQK